MTTPRDNSHNDAAPDAAAGIPAVTDDCFRLLFECAPDAYLVYNPEGVICACNVCVARLFGVAREKLRGACLFSLESIEENDRVTLKNASRNDGSQNEDYTCEIGIRSPGGAPSVIEFKMHRFRHGGSTFIFAAARDITARKHNEEEIKSLASFTSEDPQPSLRIGGDGTLLYANAASTPIVMSWECRMGERVPEEWHQLISDVITTGLRENVEFELKGQVFSFVVVPVGNSYVNLYGRDVTDRKRAEVKLQNAYTELKETQTQLIQAEKMNVVGRLASGVAHEVKNPLAIILQGVDYLSKNITSDDENLHSILTYMEEAVKRADGIIRGLLDFSSVSALEMKPENLNEVVEGALSLIKHEFAKSHISVTRELGDSVPEVEIDKNRVEQIFINIFMNAIHAMPEGGELTVRTYSRKKERKIAGQKTTETPFYDIEQQVVFAEVEDTGSGVPEDMLDKIFDPFFTTRRGRGGTGLGLSIVKNIIQMHNGTIELENRKKGGARVRISFTV